MATVAATSLRGEPSAHPQAALSLRDISVARGGRRIVEGASFNLSPGGAVILKGPNGSGKTTLLRAIAGLAPIDAGAVALAEEVASAGELRRRTIFCSHADAVKAQLTVRENIAFWRALYDAPEARIDDALGSFDLRALAATRAANLSAGQRRRLSLSRLLIAQKRVWLLDEPTASMDANSAARLESIIEAHLAEGGSAIIATHDRIAIKDAQTFILGARAAA